ncbi:MAG: ABC transporter permease [Caldilineaceae bacterium]|nr:ABC transporter permease [Caldilineaceae bacterium]
MKRPMLWFHPTFIRRQLTSTGNQSLVLISCVALAMVTLVALRGFGDSVNRALLRDARALQAADIVIDSNFPLSAPLQQAIQQLVTTGEAEAANLYEFLSVVRVATGEATLLANLKVVDPGYPFYGTVTLASGRAFHTVLQPGVVVVAPEVLERLQLQVGDTLRIGQATLTIGDVVTFEPDRPVTLFTLGPRIFIPSADLAALDLVKEGSRVNYTVLLQLSMEAQLNSVTEQLRAVREPQEEVENYRSARSGVQRFFDNLLLFLGLVAIFTLLLAGIGIQSALTALLRERSQTIAVIKTMGASGRFVTVNWLAVVLLLGLVGTVLGIAAGFCLALWLPQLLGNLLPSNLQLTISLRTLGEGILLGLVVVTCFTFLPIYQLDELKPNFIFRKENPPFVWRLPYLLVLLGLVAFFVAMVFWQLQRFWLSLYFIGSVLGLLALAALLTYGALWLIQRLPLSSLIFRQALRGLFRPRNATHSIIVTLSAALAVIFSIYLLEQNLKAAFVAAYPADAPNVVFLDLQPDQLPTFDQLLDQPVEYYPVIRATILAINGQTIHMAQEEQRPGDNLARTFNLTYRDDLLADEAIVQGGTLFPTTPLTDHQPRVPVSLLDELRELYPFALGDQITFRIQGVPLEAVVTSIRTRTAAEDFRPFFLFVFPTAVLQSAPQTIFTATQLPPAQIGPLRNRIVAALPNVTVIDITETITNAALVAERLVQIIRFFTLFSVLAGVLIVVSSIFATRQARIQEAVYYKVLGARRRFVQQVFMVENLLLGLISALLALLMAQIGSWALCHYLFAINYHPAPGASLGLLLATIVLVVGVGMAASGAILRSKPILILRELTATE